MNAPFSQGMDKAAFNRWVERQERKYEWKDGRVVQMPNVTKAHARIVANFLFAIGGTLDRDKWSVTASDLGVEGEKWVRYPDVIVEPMDADDKSRRAERAVLLVEVLSPSSVGTDFSEQLDEYTSFGPLEAYIVASQEEPIVWVWQRDGASRAFPKKPEEIAGRQASVTLRALGVSLPLAELYRGIAAGGV